MSAPRLLILVLIAGCKVSDPPPISTVWTDDFQRSSLGPTLYPSGDGYRVVDGVLSAKGAHNHPLWLRAKLPRNVRIELDCWSTEARGDLKVEVFGDGRSFDPDGNRYTATGYEVIFGGWYNSKSIIARLDEHGTDMAARTAPKVIPNQHYHWKIERTGKTIRWWVTPAGTPPVVEPFLTYDDPQPLEGPGHEYFAINNWETDTWFDNLVITPL
ncbi:MAG: hypothetical protein NT062_10890 [Proteobacteria bacterium]|nr:hypothetical protein [Pseudomonadota bacterium]